MKRLENAIHRITKKLGGLNAKLAIEALHQKDFETVADILLNYYDKAYLKGLSFRDKQRVHKVSIEDGDPDKIVRKLIELYRSSNKFQGQKVNYESHLS